MMVADADAESDVDDRRPMTDERRPPPLAVWLSATRPKTLGAALCPVLLGATIARVDGVFAWGPVVAAFAEEEPSKKKAATEFVGFLGVCNVFAWSAAIAASAWTGRLALRRFRE